MNVISYIPTVAFPVQQYGNQYKSSANITLCSAIFNIASFHERDEFQQHLKLISRIHRHQQSTYNIYPIEILFHMTICLYHFRLNSSMNWLVFPHSTKLAYVIQIYPNKRFMPECYGSDYSLPRKKCAYRNFHFKNYLWEKGISPNCKMKIILLKT